MKCLNCSKKLSSKKLISRFGCLEYECPCGVKYSLEVVNEYENDKSMKKEWNHIRRWRLFEIEKIDGLKNYKQLRLYRLNKKIVHPLYYKIYPLLIRKGWIKDEFYKQAS